MSRRGKNHTTQHGKHNVLSRMAKSCWKTVKGHGEWLIKEAFFVIIMLVIVVPAINRSDQTKYQDRRDIDAFIVTLKTLSYNDENTYTFCQHQKKGGINKEEFKQGLMLINKERNSNFFEVVAVLTTMRSNHLISEDGYNTVLEFTRWNNNLYNLEMNVCSANLKNEEELKVWIQNIVKKIRP